MSVAAHGEDGRLRVTRAGSHAFVLREWLAAEGGPGRLLPWLPVAFGGGIAAYFSLETEPSLLIGLPAAALGLLLAAWWRARAGLFAVLAFSAAVAAGFGTATLRTSLVEHEVLERPAFGATLAGFVEKREERERTDRFVLRVERASGAPDGVPERVRLSVKKGTAPAVGSYVELRARLLPPLPPLRPGGYDFARDLYFHGIGASGFVLGAIKTIDAPEPQGAWLSYAAGVQGLRDAIDQRIRAAIGGDARAIATAILTGRRDAVSDPVNEALFISGLGHILSISGYHMAVVAGVVFFAVRALLALIPALALGFPIKKWSAFAAFAAVTFYLLLSGAEVATQRSFVMIAIVLIGVMADRRAITFRTLAIAALAVMVLAPESVVHPSFQMSGARSGVG
jgi:competence protein ComEC